MLNGDVDYFLQTLTSIWRCSEHFGKPTMALLLQNYRRFTLQNCVLSSPLIVLENQT